MGEPFGQVFLSAFVPHRCSTICHKSSASCFIFGVLFITWNLSYFLLYKMQRSNNKVYVLTLMERNSLWDTKSHIRCVTISLCLVRVVITVLHVGILTPCWQKWNLWEVVVNKVYKYTGLFSQQEKCWCCAWEGRWVWCFIDNLHGKWC